MVLKSKRNKQFAVRHSKNIKNSCKRSSKKDSWAIQTTQPSANSTEAKSEAILPNQRQPFSKRFDFIQINPEKIPTVDLWNFQDLPLANRAEI